MSLLSKRLPSHSHPISVKWHTLVVNLLSKINSKYSDRETGPCDRNLGFKAFEDISRLHMTLLRDSSACPGCVCLS